MIKELSANTNLSHYRIISKIGKGGMGEVYLAEDTNPTVGRSDSRSVHRYERGKEIMHEAVKLLEDPAKILLLARKSETKKAVNY